MTTKHASAEDKSDSLTLAHDLHIAHGKIHPDVTTLPKIPYSEIRHHEVMAADADGIEFPKPDEGCYFALDNLDENSPKRLDEGVKTHADGSRSAVIREDHGRGHMPEPARRYNNHPAPAAAHDWPQFIR